MPVLTQKKEKISLSAKDYQTLLKAYQELGQVLFAAKKPKKKAISPLKTLYGVWEGVKIDEADFDNAEKSLFKTSF